MLSTDCLHLSVVLLAQIFFARTQIGSVCSQNIFAGLQELLLTDFRPCSLNVGRKYLSVFTSDRKQDITLTSEVFTALNIGSWMHKNYSICGTFCKFCSHSVSVNKFLTVVQCINSGCHHSLPQELGGLICGILQSLSI